jgi:hypothetical protein
MWERTFAHILFRIRLDRKQVTRNSSINSLHRARLAFDVYRSLRSEPQQRRMNTF